VYGTSQRVGATNVMRIQYAWGVSFHSTLKYTI
jgi:hypothetical protein